MWKRYITDLCATIQVSMKLTTLFQRNSSLYQTFQLFAFVRIRDHERKRKKNDILSIYHNESKSLCYVSSRGITMSSIKKGCISLHPDGMFRFPRNTADVETATTRGLVARAIRTRSLPNRGRKRFGRAHAHAQYVRSAFARATQLSRRVHARTRARTHLPVVPAIA